MAPRLLLSLVEHQLKHHRLSADTSSTTREASTQQSRHVHGCVMNASCLKQCNEA
jgi:hypothetical protein